MTRVTDRPSDTISNPCKVLVVIGQGRKDSLCHFLQRSACGALTSLGATVRVHDLLADGFDPVLHLPGGARHALDTPALSRTL